MEKNVDSLKVLASGAIISLFFGIAGYILMFLFKLLTARLLGPEKFGMFEIGMTLLNMGALISLFGIQTGIGRYVAIYEERKDFQKLNGYLRFIFRLPILISLFISFLTFISAPMIRDFFGFDSLFVSIIRIIALIIPFRVINEIIYQIFYSKNKILEQNISNNLIEKAMPIVGVGLVYFYELSMASLLWMFLFSVFLVCIFNYSYLKLKISFEKNAGTQNDYIAWLKFSTPLFFANIFAFAINWTDNIAIGRIMNGASVGIYAISFSLASFLLFFQTSFVGVFFPIISRLYAHNKMDQINLIYNKAQKWAFGMALPFALIFIFFAREIIVGIYGESFAPAASSLIILTVGFLFNVYTGMNVVILKLIKNTKYILTVKMSLAFLNVALMIIMIHRIGILGAAATVALVMILEQIIYMKKVKDKFEIIRDDLKNLNILLLGVSLMLVLKWFFDYFGYSAGVLQLIFFSLIYLSVFACGLFMTKIFDKSDLLIFKKVITNERRPKEDIV